MYCQKLGQHLSTATKSEININPGSPKSHSNPVQLNKSIPAYLDGKWEVGNYFVQTSIFLNCWYAECSCACEIMSFLFCLEGAMWYHLFHRYFSCSISRRFYGTWLASCSIMHLTPSKDASFAIKWSERSMFFIICKYVII